MCTTDASLDHLRIVFANDPAAREWAATDDDLAGVRDDPSLLEALTQ